MVRPMSCCHPLSAESLEGAQLWAEPYEVAGAGGRAGDGQAEFSISRSRAERENFKLMRNFIVSPGVELDAAGNG